MILKKVIYHVERAHTFLRFDIVIILNNILGICNRDILKGSRLILDLTTKNFSF